MENQVDDLMAFLKGMKARLDHDQQHETLMHSPDASTATLQVQAEDEVKDLQSSIKELWFKVEELTLQQQESSSTFVPTPITGAEKSNALSPPSAAAAAAPSATGSAVTDQHQHQPAKAQQKRKGRRIWSRELHSRFVAAVQRLGGTQVATPKQIRELMKVDGLTTDEVKIHLQNYRLHTRRRVSSDGGHQYAGRLWSSSSSFGRGQRKEDVMMN